MSDVVSKTVECTDTSEYQNRLRNAVSLTDMDDINNLIAGAHLVIFKGLRLGSSDLTIYKHPRSNPVSGFYIRNHAGMYKYPEAFTTTQKLDIQREDPSTPTLDALGMWNSSSKECWLIAKVMANATDSIRVIFADPESSIIRAIISNYANDNMFNRLDVGGFIKMDRRSVYVVDNSTYRETVIVPMRKTIRGQDGYMPSDTRYVEIRDDYISKFLKCQYDEIQLKCFKFGRHSFSYSDTVVETSWAGIKKALSVVADSYHEDFTNLFPEVLKGCTGIPFKVNGTPVKVDKVTTASASVLYYVNGHKISAPDLTEVLEHVLCFPKAGKVYTDYVTTVSKISLKFHKAMAKGMELRFRSSDLAVKFKSAAGNIRRPGGMNRSEQTLSTTLRVNKVVGRKTSFDFMGMTRYIEDFDMFARIAKSGSRSSHDCNAEMPRVEGTMHHRDLIERMLAIDLHLRPDCRFLKDFKVTSVEFIEGAYQDGSWNSKARIMRPGIAASDDNVAMTNELHDKLCEVYKDSLSSEEAILRKSYELLQQVMKETNATCVEDNGLWVYKVTGLSGVKYRVEESSAAVHLDNPEKAHICIVKASNDIDGYDYIASLLMALAQDKFTARNISTLEQHVKKAA